MKTSYLLMLSMVSAAVLGQPSRQVIELSQSSVKLRTCFDQVNVKDFTWIFKTQQVNYRIIKIQNGHVVENLNNRYKPTHHGTVLGINNLTKNDSGNYTAVITEWDNSMKEDNIDLTVYDPVPTPKIESEVERIGDQCYVTLNCSSSSNTDGVFYTWKYRYNDSEYENINKTGNAIKIPLYHHDTQFLCKLQNPADHKNSTVHVKHCSEVESNTTSIIIGVVALVVVLVVAFLVLWFNLSKSSSNTSEQDNQKDEVKTSQMENAVEEEENYKNKKEEYFRYSDKYTDDQHEGKAEEDKIKMKEHKEKDEHQIDDILTRPVQEIGIHRVWTTGKKENEVKKHKKEDEHYCKDENREILLEDSRNPKVWAPVLYKNEYKKHMKDYEQRNTNENREIQLQDTSDWNDRVRKDEVEENEKKDDDEIDEGSSLVEKTDVATALKTR